MEQALALYVHSLLKQYNEDGDTMLVYMIVRGANEAFNDSRWCGGHS